MRIEIRHEGLNKHRIISGKNKEVLESKAAAQIQIWNVMWEKKKTDLEEKDRKQRALLEKELKKELAAERTTEAQQILRSLENTLQHTLSVNDRIDWDSLLDYKPFPKPQPKEPRYIAPKPEPQETDKVFQPKKKWYFAFLGSARQKAKYASKESYLRAHAAWKVASAETLEENRFNEAEYRRICANWEAEKEKYLKKQEYKNAKIVENKVAYFNNDAQAIVEYCDMVLSNSTYLDSFPIDWNIEFRAENKILAVDYELPSPNDLPRLKEVKYNRARDEFTLLNLRESDFNNLYDSLLYQIALRTVHELFEADQINAIKSIVFNGWVRSIDKGTGNEVNACILSVMTTADEFKRIDLKNVDPKTCFKALKGVGSSKLHGLSAVAPILRLDTEDKRFVSSYAIVENLDSTTNLATIDWEDFEHLIREVFEKRFSSKGGEVKVTRASRDGGVDAVAFDPDPLSGGKIVIQAKRYTNTVGVGAVRELYGAVLNEGANKGILVTTSDFGPDAYDFIKGKPLSLLSGANLLHLLGEYGYKATIDLKAAKQIIADQKESFKQK